MPALATFRVVGQDSTAFPVLFNPASLKVSLTNRLQDEDSGSAGTSGGQPRQNTRVTTTKLDMELAFDTTQDGSDVRELTGQLKALATAPEGEHPRPPGVEFRWGRFKYVGVIDSLAETLDFWSYEGVPLRAAIQLSMQGTRLDEVAEGAPARATLNTVPANGTGTTGAGLSFGAPEAGRVIAAANGIEDMRMTVGGTVAVSAGVQLKAAASFSAGVSVGGGASAGFGIGASGGAGAGIGAGASLGFGAGATAGVGASAGAFAGLGASKTATAQVRIDPARLLPPPPRATAASGGFDITGRAVGTSSPGLSASLNVTAGTA
jgi:hypothetical protein